MQMEEWNEEWSREPVPIWNSLTVQETMGDEFGFKLFLERNDKAFWFSMQFRYCFSRVSMGQISAYPKLCWGQVPHT